MNDSFFSGSEDDMEESPYSILFRDVTLNQLPVLIFVILVLLMIVTPIPTKKEAEENKSPFAGSVMIEARWPDGIDADVDLWVMGPDGTPVGYSNKGGHLFNLLRDDLGKLADATKKNEEMSIARGLISGEYVVNLHLYRNNEGIQPIPVDVLVYVSPKYGEAAQPVLITGNPALLQRVGQEITVFRFSLDKQGRVVENSVSSLFRPLRSGGKS